MDANGLIDQLRANESLRGILRAVIPKRLRNGLHPYADALEACEELLRHGRINEIIPVLGLLVSDRELGRDARELLLTCKHLRRSGVLEEAVPINRILALVRDRAPLARDPAEPEGVLVRPAPGADAMLVVFTTGEGNFWISLDLLHHSLRPFGWHIVYLRDERACFHLAGINGLAPDYAGSVAALHAIAAELGARSICCIGGSAGGYSALRYALDLGARAVMAFSAPTSLAVPPEDAERSPKLRPLYRAAPEMAVDLYPLYAAAARPPRTTLVYGGANQGDRDAALRLAGIPGIEPLAVEGYPLHDTLAYFMINRKFERVFELLTAPR